LLDVGHGLAVVVRLPGGETLLFDAGSTAQDGGARRLRRTLAALGIRRIDHLVLSHPDADHTAAVSSLARTWLPTHLWLAARTAVDRRRLVSELLANGTQLKLLEPGVVSCERAGVVWRWWVPAQASLTTNACSLMLELRSAEWSLLLCGDLEGPSLSQFIDQLAPVTMLQLPHHGHPLGGIDALLAAVRPRIALASNHRALPLAIHEACERWRCELVETRRSGAIQMRCKDPQTLWQGWRNPTLPE
jgi:competence protein ComEC